MANQEIQEPKGKTGKIILIIVLVLIAIFIILAIFGAIFYLWYKSGKEKEKTERFMPNIVTTTPQKTETPIPTATPLPTPKKTDGLIPTPHLTIPPSPTPKPQEKTTPKAGWQTYENARYKFSLQVPTSFSEKQESANGDGVTFTSWNPPMTIKAWGELNSLNLTPQQAIDFDKEDFAKNEGVENFEVVEEEDITLGGERAVKSVWAYSVSATGDAITSARVYVVRGENIYKIEFLVDTGAFAEYAPMFDEIVASFEFTPTPN